MVDYSKIDYTKVVKIEVTLVNEKLINIASSLSDIENRLESGLISDADIKKCISLAYKGNHELSDYFWKLEREYELLQMMQKELGSLLDIDSLKQIVQDFIIDGNMNKNYFPDYEILHELLWHLKMDIEIYNNLKSKNLI